MTKAEIISSLLAQARDKDALANGEADSIFADDARALREAAELLVADYYGDGEWIDRDYCNLTRDVTHWMPLPDEPKEEDDDE